MDHAKAVACYCKDGKKMTSVMCMAVAIALEARVEPVSGIGAVADVIMTRVADPRYPDTVCGVVLDKGEFPWNANGLPSATVGGEDWRVVQDIAADAIAAIGAGSCPRTTTRPAFGPTGRHTTPRFPVLGGICFT